MNWTETFFKTSQKREKKVSKPYLNCTKVWSRPKTVCPKLVESLVCLFFEHEFEKMLKWSTNNELMLMKL